MPDPNEQQDKRKFMRFPLPTAHYETKSGTGISGDSSLWDVSREGFRIQSANPIEKGTVLEFKMTIPGFRTVEFQGEVCWSEPQGSGYGQGLRFTEIDPAVKAALLEFAYQCWLNDGNKK